MWKQTGLLTRIQLCNLWGWNQIKYGKDPKKKNRLKLLMVTYGFLGILIAFYAAMIGYGCVMMGMAQLIPAYVLAAVSLLILFFSIYKAGSILFDTKAYEMMVSLPVKPAAIVVSRFMTMYVENLVMGMVVLFPAAGVYAYFIRPGLLFYITILAGAFLLPFMPMTIATAIGALVSAVSSRMKHKNLVSILLLMGLTIGILLLSMGSSTGAIEMTQEMFEDVAAVMAQQIYAMYPPARLFTAGVVEGNMAAFLLFAGLSLGAFLLLAALVQWKFTAICTALNARTARKNYELQSLMAGSPLKALYIRELKRYFSSVIYVCNTLIGYLLMVVFAVAVSVTGLDKMEQMMGLPNLFKRILPLVLALICSFSSTTTSSISMEGRQWWLIRSLPVSTEQILNSKMLVNLTAALPCYAVSAAILLFSVDVSLLERLWIVVIPLVYILFVTVAGITINLRMPVFDWEAEAAVVKQSGAAFTALAVGVVSALAPVAVLIALPSVPAHLVMGVTAAVILGVTVVLYGKNSRTDLKTIE